jgi:hypothetical protein
MFVLYSQSLISSVYFQTSLQWHEDIRLAVSSSFPASQQLIITVRSQQFIGKSDIVQLEEKLDSFLLRTEQLQLHHRTLASIGASLDFKSFFTRQTLSPSILESSGLFLQLDQAELAPGERLSGAITLNQRRQKFYKRAFIRIYGRTSVSWSESQSTNSGRGTSSTTHSSKVPSIEICVPLPIAAERVGKEFNIDSGTTTCLQDAPMLL